MQPRVEVVEPVSVPPDLDTVRQDGWDAGFVAGEAAAQAALAPLKAALVAVAKALDAACQIDADRLRPVFVALVQRVAEAVLMAELKAGAAVLLPLVEVALGLVQIGEAAVLRAHPDMLAALQGHFPEIAVAADAALARDEFVVMAPGFVIGAGLSARLAEVVARVA